MNIAIIDDSETILLVLESILVNFFKNVKIKKYTSSESFLEYPLMETFSLIITDYSMPGISGKELAKLIRSKHKNIPIMMITGNGTNELVRELFINKIIDDYIDKPVNSETLVTRVNNLLETSSKDRYIWIKELHSNNRVKLLPDSIDFITTAEENKVLEISINNCIYKTRGTIAEIIDRLDKNFIRISRSLAINHSNIKQLNYSEFSVNFFSGSSINVSRAKFIEIEKLI